MNRLVQIRAYDCAIDFMMDLDDSFLADQAVMDWTKLCGCCEPEVVYAAYRVLKAGDLVIDGGANTGYTSMAFAAMVGAYGKVMAFEPDPANQLKLERNIRLNDAYQIAISAQPLWSDNEEVHLYFNHKDPGGHSLRPFGYATEFKKPMLAVTIDSLNVAPKFIKLDIEGAEISALHGARQTIRRHRPYVVCEINQHALANFGESNVSLRNYAKTLGYDTYLLLRSYHFPVLIPEGVEIVTPVDNTNVLLATQEMVAAAYPQAYYVLPENVVEYLKGCNG